MRLPRLLLTLLILGLLAFTAAVLLAPEGFRREMLLWRMEKLDEDLYARPDLPQDDRRELRAVLIDAIARAEAATGEPLTLPRMVYADTPALKDSFAVGNPFANSVFHGDGVLAVIGPRGLSVDVIAHLLLHAEVKARLGEEAFALLPSWYDEGLCAQVDGRAFLDEAALAALPPPTRPFAAADRPGPELFQGREGETQLARAKRQHQAWMEGRKPHAGWRLLDRLAAGGDFTELYSSGPAKRSEAAAD
jgi:hypothetical protein